jgi:pyruvate kinase
MLQKQINRAANRAAVPASTATQCTIHDPQPPPHRAEVSDVANGPSSTAVMLLC